MCAHTAPEEEVVVVKRIRPICGYDVKVARDGSDSECTVMGKKR